MSRHDFPDAEFEARRRTIAGRLEGAGLAGFIAFHPAVIHWLTGAEAKGYQGFQCLVIPAGDGPLTLVTRESERAEIEDEARVDRLFTWGGPGQSAPLDAFAAAARALGLDRHVRIGFEAPAFYLHPHHLTAVRAALTEAELVEDPRLVHDPRLVKSPRELEMIREAARLADLSVDALHRALAPGRTELEVTAQIYAGILVAGGGLPAVPPNFVAGPRAAYSHGAPSARPLARGDFGNVEYGVPYRRYIVSIGRQFAIGAPTARMRELYAVARAAADACIAAIRDGVSATAPFEAARSVIDGAGLEAARVHTIGYAVAPGFPPATGEPLQLSAESAYQLREGMVLSICPPVFVAPERLGARVVDNVLVTRDGAEILSKTSRDLIVVD